MFEILDFCLNSEPAAAVGVGGSLIRQRVRRWHLRGLTARVLTTGGRVHRADKRIRVRAGYGAAATPAVSSIPGSSGPTDGTVLRGGASCGALLASAVARSDVLRVLGRYWGGVRAPALCSGHRFRFHVQRHSEHGRECRDGRVMRRPKEYLGE